MGSEDDARLLEALKSNWQHARHVEDLRLRMATVYIIAMLSAGLAAVGNQSVQIKTLAFTLGLLITVFSWGMTHKWNIEFVNQIRKADSCAKRLKIAMTGEDASQGSMHGFMGFPTRDPRLPWLNVRMMFNLFYASIAVIWVIAWIHFTL